MMTSHPVEQLKTRFRDFKSVVKTKEAALRNPKSGSGCPGKPLNKLEEVFADFLKQRGSCLIGG